MVGGIVRVGRAIDGVASAERAGFVVLYERSGVRAAVSTTGVCDLRFQIESHRLDGGIFHFARAAIGRRRAAAGAEAVHSLSRNLRGISFGAARGLVRSSYGRHPVPVQD